VRTPTPARPGPGFIPDGIVSVVELPANRRIGGQLAGDERAYGRGPGIELDRIRAYVPGDDIRTIDWNVTARTGEPHVREYVPERQLTTWLLLDRSASMHFGTQQRRKADVADGVAQVVGRVGTRRAGRLGVITFGAGRLQVHAPRVGRLGTHGLHAVMESDVAEEGAAETSVADGLRLVARIGRTRGRVVVVSDFRGPADWSLPLAEVAARHSVVCIEVHDLREGLLVDVGELTLVDPETGRLLRVDTSNRRLRSEFATAAAQERDALAMELRRLHVQHIRLSTDGPWLADLVQGLGGSRAARSTP
jgi:uncharacterized protein (DUF58 family)